MSLQYICDCCNRTPAEYQIQEKVRVRRWFHYYTDSFRDTYRICEDCWNAISTKIRKGK